MTKTPVTGKPGNAELKTRPNTTDVGTFIAAVNDKQKRADSQVLIDMMKRVTDCDPVMWGTSIIGFGSYCYSYASGRSAEWCATGFSPRKSALTIYIMPGFSNYHALMSQLGHHKTGKSCLYIKRLPDVDLDVLEQLVDEAWNFMKVQYPG